MTMTQFWCRLCVVTLLVLELSLCAIVFDIGMIRYLPFSLMAKVIYEITFQTTSDVSFIVVPYGRMLFINCILIFCLSSPVKLLVGQSLFWWMEQDNFKILFLGWFVPILIISLFGCLSSVFIMRIIYKSLHECPFDHIALAVRRKTGIS